MSTHSAVVVTWNAESTISGCLGSIRREGGDAIEILVVDNASTDGTLAAVLRTDTRAQFLSNNENVGFARAVNRGLAEATGDRVLLLNPDAVLLPGSLAALDAALDGSEGVAAAGPALVDERGRLDFYAARNIPRIRDLLFEGMFLTRVLRGVPPFDRYLLGRWDHRSRRRVDCLSGACLLVAREAVARVGGMDERYFLFYEDVDWCQRFGRAGYLLLYVPEARVFHAAHASVGRDPFTSYRHAVEASRLFFARGSSRRRFAVDLVWAIVAAWRTLGYSALVLIPSVGRRFRGRPWAFARLFAYVVRTAARA